MLWASTAPLSGRPATRSATPLASRGLGPLASHPHRQRVVLAAEVDGDDAAARDGRRGDQAEVEQQLDLVLGGELARRVPRAAWCGRVAMRPRATVSASPVSIDAPSEPAAPKASRQNCSRAEAEAALFLISSIATSRISGSFSSSSTSRPLTIAPTGADHVVANARAQQRGEVHRGEGDHCHGRVPVVNAAESARRSAWACGRDRIGFAVAAATGAMTRKPTKGRPLERSDDDGRLDLANAGRDDGVARCWRASRSPPARR